MIAKDLKYLLTRFFSVSCIFFYPLEGVFASDVLFSEATENKNALSSQEDFYFAKKDTNSKFINEAPLLDFEIVSESQSWENENLFVAEGNVTASINGRNLEADRIEFDQLNQTIVAIGNINFRTGSNSFSATKFIYYLDTKVAEIENAYGVVDIKLLSKEMNIVDQDEFNLLFERKEEEFKPKDVEWVDRLSFEGGFSSDMRVIDEHQLKEDKAEKSKKWRVKASKIIITQSGWKAQEATFTNDPFNPTQLKIYAYKVELKEGVNGIDNATISADKSSLILEDKLKIPFGNRKFQLGDQRLFRKWVFGMDGEDRDGLYIGRKFRPIKIGKNYQLTLQPQYLIQRSFDGKTNAYPQSGQSSNSPKVITTTSSEDLFGLEAKLKGKIFGFDNIIDAKITTFNRERFANGARYSTSLKKKFDFDNIKQLEFTAFASYPYNIFNGSIGSSDIYTSYGAKVDKSGSWENGKKQFSYNISGGLGNYKAEKLQNLDLISSWRTNVQGNINMKYNIKEFKSSEPFEINNSLYSPTRIKPGLYLNSNLSASYFAYDSGQQQSTFTVGLGPQITLGHLKKKYFDYTKFSVIPSITVKGGDSPFKFDNANDLVKIKFDLTQQLVGPMIFKHVEELNIDTDSANYGKSISSKSALIWQRRAYELGLFYNFKTDAGGISFALNGFDYKGKAPSF